MKLADYNFKDNQMPAPLTPAFEMEGWWVWCGSVIQDPTTGLFNMFASIWPKYLPFHPGWGMASKIVRATSDKLQGPYTFQEVVLGSRAAQYWDGRSVHNPSIQKYKDDYILFYMGTTFPYPDVPRKNNLNHFSPEWLCARSNKRIGYATAKSLAGPWHRFDQPILEVRPDKFDNFFTSNPAPCINEDGSCLLVYKTRSYALPPYDTEMEMFSSMKLGVAFAKNWKGPYERLTDKPLFDEEEGSLEDPFIWKSEDTYNMIAKDWSGLVCGTVGDLVFANSKNGINWDIKKGFTALSCKIKMEDGSVKRFGNLDRPFLFIKDNEIKGLFTATNNGIEAEFRTLTNSYNAFIPFR